MKWCSACRTTKIAADFGKNRASADGLQSVCRACRAARAAKDYATRPEFRARIARNTAKTPKEVRDGRKRRARNLTAERAYLVGRNYGLNVAEYEALYLRQHGCCPTCLRPLVMFARPACIDHCHATGKVRGIVCHQCNIALGGAKDDAATLSRMIAYLEAAK